MKKCFNKNKKVLIIINAFAIGGAQNMVYELLRCIDRSVYAVDVLCYGKRIENSLTRKIEDIQTVKYLGIDERITPKVIVEVLKEISRLKPDIIHSHLGGTVFGTLWGILHRKPVIVTVHTIPEKAFSKDTIFLLKVGQKLGVVNFVAVSKENQKLLTTFFNIPEEGVPYINNGINLQRYYKKKHENFTFINVGRQDENKNQIAIVRAFNRIYQENKTVKLILLGEGEKHQILIDEIAQKGMQDNVTIPGNVGNTEDYYAISDCYVQASHREALPLTAIEAMAAGLPVISTDVGGMKDIVSTNGYLIPDNLDEELYLAMKQVLKMSETDRNVLSQESKRIVEKYSAERMTEEYMELYKS